MRKYFLYLCVVSAAFFLSTCAGKGKSNIEESKTYIEESKTYFAIPDANFKAYLLENFDVNKDDKISLSEAKAVKEIDCSKRNIKVLDGIENFVNLERLICNDNQLEELELRYNKKLNWIVCKNNIDPLNIYFAKSSPLKNKKFVLPKNNDTPEPAQLVNPIDVSKVIFDAGKTNFIICLND